MYMNRRHLAHLLTASLSVLMLLSVPVVRAAAEGPDEMIRRLSNEVLANIKADKDVQRGDITKVTVFVDSKVMPNVNFTRMTASAVGRNWRQATPEQQKRLQEVQKYVGADLCWCAEPSERPDHRRQTVARWGG
jgi:phospholipid transport system substrate-binding protein